MCSNNMHKGACYLYYTPYITLFHFNNHKLLSIYDSTVAHVSLVLCDNGVITLGSHISNSVFLHCLASTLWPFYCFIYCLMPGDVCSNYINVNASIIYEMRNDFNNLWISNHSRFFLTAFANYLYQICKTLVL